MNTQSNLEAGEARGLRRALDRCAAEVHPHPDLEELRALIASGSAVVQAADTEDGRRVETSAADPGPSDGTGIPAPRAFRRSAERWRWLAAAAVLAVAFGVALSIAVDGGPAQDSAPMGLGAGDSVVAPQVLRLSAEAPVSYYAAPVDGGGSVSKAEIAGAFKATTRWVQIESSIDGGWWLIARAVPATAEQAGDGQWQPVGFQDAAPNARRMRLDGVEIMVTPVVGGSMEDPPVALTDWAAEAVTQHSVEEAWKLPADWSFVEQQAFELWLGPTSSILVNEVDQSGAEIAYSASTLAIPEGLDANLVPRWILLSEGFADPEQVTAESGAIGWRSNGADVVHVGGANTAPGWDSEYVQLNMAVAPGSTAASTVDAAAVVRQGLEILDS